MTTATPPAPPSTRGGTPPTERAADSIAHNLALEAELLSLLDAFTAAGIDVVVLKGIPLARRIFGQISRRRIMDNDLLVRAADVQRAHEVLQGRGYSSPPFRPLSVDLRVSFEHAMSRVDDNGRVFWAELHWHAFVRELFPVSEALLWKRTIETSLKNRRFRVFDEAMTILHLTSHFVQHACLQDRILVDLAAAWNGRSSTLDVDDLLRLSDTTRTTDALVYAFTMCTELGLVDQHPLKIQSRRAAALARVIPGSLVRRGGRALSYWTTPACWACLAPSQLPRLAICAAFPPLSLMGAIHRQPASIRLLPLYLTRLFRPFRRIFASEHADVATPGIRP